MYELALFLAGVWAGVLLTKAVIAVADLEKPFDVDSRNEKD